MAELNLSVTFSPWAKIALWFAGFMVVAGVEIDPDRVADYLVRHMTIRVVD